MSEKAVKLMEQEKVFENDNKKSKKTAASVMKKC